MTPTLPSGQSGRMAALPSGTVTLLFTDIEGSTRLWERNPTQMHGRAGPPRLLVRVGGRSRGRLRVQDRRRRLLCRVPDGGERARGCRARATRAAPEPWPEDATIRARMALHSGVCTERDGDYFGPTVNRVARLEAIGHGGQVLLSGATVALLGDDLPAACAPRHGRAPLEGPGARRAVFQVGHLRSRRRLPAVAVAGQPGFHHNLPRYATSFVGRDGRTARVQALVGGGRLLTLVGAAARGKTRLAVQVAAELARRRGRRRVAGGARVA